MVGVRICEKDKIPLRPRVEKPHSLEEGLLLGKLLLGVRDISPHSKTVLCATVQSDRVGFASRLQKGLDGRSTLGREHTIGFWPVLVVTIPRSRADFMREGRTSSGNRHRPSDSLDLTILEKTGVGSKTGRNAALRIIQQPEDVAPAEAVSRCSNGVNSKLRLDEIDGACDLGISNLRAVLVEELGDIEVGGTVDILRRRLSIKEIRSNRPVTSPAKGVRQTSIER